jgi:cysteinyl-tRNA synthetase
LTLRFYNSYGRKLMAFEPIKEGEVRMYTCGPTVWNYAHIGNFRTFVFEDVLRRYLRFKGFKVTQVMNITDIEDKIIKGMKQFHMSLEELTRFYEGAFMEDLASLNVEPAEHYPHATHHIEDMVVLVKTLLSKGYAYKADDGSIYFDVSKFKSYGALSGIRPAELRAGARVKLDTYDKEEANDFALWKAWDEGDGEVFWETELGKGRPGWHIECSAMSMKYLGETFDIHTGGMDNKFPHHENEIAQSEAATGKKFVNFWLHSDFLNIEGEEMHKSVGNVVYLRDLLRTGRDPLAVRLFLISARYRDPINLNDKSLAQAEAERERLQQFARRLATVSTGSDHSTGTSSQDLIETFTEAMDDDLNTPAALGAIFSFVKEANNEIDMGRVSASEGLRMLKALRRIDSVLGVLRFEEEPLPDPLMKLIAERQAARERRDFAAADRIRLELLEKGVVLEDSPTGTTWKRAPKG